MSRGLRERAKVILLGRVSNIMESSNLCLTCMVGGCEDDRVCDCVCNYADGVGVGYT